MVIRETANLPISDIEHAVVSPPGLDLPRFRCCLFFKYEDPTKEEYSQVQSWCMQDFREFWYSVDKDYSRVAARAAISQLKDEINILRDPSRAEERFKLLISDPAIAQALLGTVHTSNEGSSEQLFERILRSIMIENGGHIF